MKNGKLGVAVLIISVILIIGVGVFAYLKNQSVNNSGSTNIISNDSIGISLPSILSSDYDVNEKTEFGVCDGFIIKCTKSGIVWIDKNGEEKHSLILVLDNPILKISGPNILVANIGGRDVYSVENYKVKWQKTLDDGTLTDNSIINADIDKSGYVTVIQKAKRHKGAVTLLDPNGNTVFTKGKGDDFVLSAITTNDANQIMINTNDTSGITINSTLEFIDVAKIDENKGEPFAGITKKDSIFSYIKFINGNCVIAAGDDFINYYNSKKEREWSINLKKVYSVDCTYDKFTVAAVKSEVETSKLGGIQTDINTYNDNGTLRSTFTLGEGVTNIRAFESVIAINTGRQVVFTDIGGNLLGKYSSKMDIIQVEFLDRSHAVVITKSTIDIVEM